MTASLPDNPIAANALIDSLAVCGIDTVFGNLGATEMPLVVALDNPRRSIKAVLGLTELHLDVPRLPIIGESGHQDETPNTKVDAQSLCSVITATLPRDGIIADEGITLSLGFYPASVEAKRFGHLYLTGGEVGRGQTAAVDAPGRSVINIQADGSRICVPQFSWNQAHAISTALAQGGPHLIEAVLG